MTAVNGEIYIHVEEQGKSDPTLIFLHYWGGSSRTWRHVIAALANAWRTLAVDLRGWGLSDAPREDYALADFADDVERVIRARGLSDFVLVGHSMGGKIAQLIASRQPEGLAGLVLVAPSPPTPLGLPPEMLVGMEAAYASAASVAATIDQVLTAKPLTEGQRRQVIEDSLRGGAAAKIAWPRHSSQEDISAAVSAITVPVLVIAGECDRVDSVSTLETELLPRIPQARMRVLAGTGHLSPLESPGEIAALIRTFISALPKNAISARVRQASQP
ncbi:alpha/beta fold hydrolase [Sodalis sp. RH22]|uniref:alpha/beta fold hydrolase n=1 Tax=unclassified Sodalis (in: enterobacteria) TaxID=2636512 RepID=UPI0039B3DE0D